MQHVGSASAYRLGFSRKEATGSSLDINRIEGKHTLCENAKQQGLIGSPDEGGERANSAAISEVY